MRKALSIALLLLSVTACQPKFKDVPTYRYADSAVVSLSAQAHAKDIGGSIGWIAPTGSMEPTLKAYDFVVISSPAKDPYENIQNGDIVSYDPAGSPHIMAGISRVMHRAVQKDSLGWIMSGDANAHTENKWRLTAPAYHGRLVAIYRLDFTAQSAAK